MRRRRSRLVQRRSQPQGPTIIFVVVAGVLTFLLLIVFRRASQTPMERHSRSVSKEQPLHNRRPREERGEGERSRQLSGGRNEDRVRNAREELPGGIDVDRSLRTRRRKTESSSPRKRRFDDLLAEIRSREDEPEAEERPERDSGRRDTDAGDLTADLSLETGTSPERSPYPETGSRSIAGDDDSETAAAPPQAEEELRLPPVGFSKAVEWGMTERNDVDGLRATVRLIPNAYRHAMAVGVEELARIGYDGEELEKELRKLHARHRRRKGHWLVSVELSTSGSRTHYFLQYPTKRHVELVARTRRSVRVVHEDPKPRFENWQIIEQRHGQMRKIYHRPLARFDTLRFNLTAKLEPGSKAPVELKLAGIVCVREKDHSDHGVFEGINLGVKQISSTGWEDQVLPLLRVKFYPSRWKGTSVPAEFETILQWLEEKR